MGNFRFLFVFFFVVAVSTAVAAPDKAVDPSKLKDKVTIKLGNSLAVQFERKGNALSNPKVVERPVDKQSTLSLDFRKQDDMLILTAQNPFPKTLKYRALARHKGRDVSIETSVVPVLAGLFGIEAWQEPIEELVLFDFKLVDQEP